MKSISRSALFRHLTLSGSLTHGITCDGFVVQNDVLLTAVSFRLGQASLLGAQIGGQLICDHATFTAIPVKDDNDSNVALYADGIVVKSDVSFSDNFSAKGRVRLLGAQIGGQFTCNGAAFAAIPVKDDDDSSIALDADGIVVKSDVSFNQGFSSKGSVRLLGAQIDGQLDCSGGTFADPPSKELPESGDALLADGISS